MVAFPEGKFDSPEKQAESLGLAVKEFIDCIRGLPAALFHEKIDDWTPRDVTAHLVGWNDYTLEGCRQIMNGETPPFFVDPGDDFSKVNAVLVREYDAPDVATLIGQVETSLENLNRFILSIDPADWRHDYGVTYRGEAVTVENCVDGLIYDYGLHRRQIEEWTEKIKGG